MTDYMAQMLNELMGPQRNAAPGAMAAIEFDGPEVCKDFLAGFCPNEIFKNTKNDLGFCQLIHDNALKKTYEESSKRWRLGYEEKFLEKIKRLHYEVKRKIEKNEKRLDVTQGRNLSLGSEDTTATIKEKFDEQKKVLGEKIAEKMEEADKAGREGNVELATKLIAEADELEKERDNLEGEMNAKVTKMMNIEEMANNLNKPMHVCQTCGCFMLVNDAQSRIDDHFAGKLHVSYARIATTIDEMEKEIEKRKEERKRDDKKEDRPDDRRRDRDRERERERSRSRDRRDSRDRRRSPDRRRSDHRRRDSSRDRHRDRRRH